MRHDPLNDIINSIKNASSIGQREIVIGPAAGMIGRVLKVMQDYNYLKSFEVIEDGKGGKFRISLNTTINNCGIIKPRYSVKKVNLDRFESRHLKNMSLAIFLHRTSEF